MAEKYISLGEFERWHGVNRGTVSRKARELGWDTASGLSPAAYEAMLNEFGISPAQEEEPTPAQIEPAPLAVLDPFAGVEAGQWNPGAALSVIDRGQAAAAIAHNAQQLIQSAAIANQQTVQAATGAADQLGTQLGTMLAHRAIAASEAQRQRLLGEYLQSQGVTVGEPAAAGGGAG